ncbi:hypothetical protein [Bradyrhizobium sp. 1]|uniref:hypothetical protein n=1 Tax=Bradyrhizobium sp. 1 TaxID=241591 RepID=UPI001FF80E69|nr:hypothetical protein [Bradyrhizobium sp. 1]MCK1394541.1 hypothetical protein [Bradyrhizobium sp. 1]
MAKSLIACAGFLPEPFEHRDMKEEPGLSAANFSIPDNIVVERGLASERLIDAQPARRSK